MSQTQIDRLAELKAKDQATLTQDERNEVKQLEAIEAQPVTSTPR